MLPFLDRKRRFAALTQRMLARFRLTPLNIDDGRVTFRVNVGRSYVFEFRLVGSFVQLAGFPNIGFKPRFFPMPFLAHLLVRNGEIVAGSWLLTTYSDRVWCSFAYSIPWRRFNSRTAKEGLEISVSEVNRIAMRYEHLGTL